MKRVEAPSYPVSIFIAGEAYEAVSACLAYCEVGLCVTVTETRYVYTGDEEFGVIVGLINYPRFPKTPDEIWAHAEALAETLRLYLGQESYTIQAPDKTVWYSWREADNTPDRNPEGHDREAGHGAKHESGLPEGSSK
jgi:hypothetical protein